MAYFDTTWYISSVGHAAVTVRPQNTAVAAGVVRRQFTAPAVNSERCFVCVVAGTTANVTDATWVLTRGAKTTDGTVTWQECTGASAVNGDLASTPTWAAMKAAGAPSLGVVIQRNSGASYQICTTAGTLGAAEPSFSNTAGATTSESGGSAVWTSLGVVGGFSAWGAPHARLTAAYATNWGTPGNKFWVADNHAETIATAMTLTNPASGAGGPTYTICVDRTAALPPVAANYNTGASINTTVNANITFNVGTSGSAYYQGIAFNAGSGSATGADINIGGSGITYIFKNCAFALGNSNVSSRLTVGAGSIVVIWDNCTVQFSSTSHLIAISSANFEWRNTASPLQGATMPAALFQPAGSSVGFIFVCRGVDFSAFSGQLLASGSQNACPLVFEDCKLHASLNRYGASGVAGYATSAVIMVRCDSGATNYKATRDEYAGSEITETSITRVGGATDGTTATSTKIVTNAQTSFLTPYRQQVMAIWNDTTGADVTVTVCGTVNSASLPTNAEVWMDVQYPGSSSSPIASFKSTSKSHPLATAANVSSDGSSWNGGGSGAGWSPFKLVATLTSPQPQMKGFIYVSVKIGKASATYYIDPLVTLT